MGDVKDAKGGVKHIVIDARTIGTGTGMYIKSVIDELVGLDRFNRYTIILDTNEQYRPSGANFSVYQSGASARNKTFFFAGNIPLAWEIYKMKPDLVHFAFQWKPFMYLKRNYILTIYDLTQFKKFHTGKRNIVVFRIFQMMLNLAVRVYAHGAKLILTSSEYVKNDVAKTIHIKPEKILNILGACPAPNPAKAEVVSGLDGKGYLLYVGTAHPHKNLAGLIDAYGILQKTNPDLHLVLVGKIDEFYNKLQVKARGMGLDSKIHFTGWVSEGEKIWLYQNAQCYVFPSLSEGFGLPTLEAMSYGCPVVSSNATCLPEINGEAAIYFDPNNAEDMAGAVSKVLNDKVLRGKLVAEGENQYKKYSWRAVAELTYAEYMRLLKVGVTRKE